MKKFLNRNEAGQQLAALILQKIPKIQNGLILALPRGGVVVAAVVAKVLDLPLDIIVTRKIGAPFNPEYAVAAVSSRTTVSNPREKVDPDYLKIQTQKERQEIERRMRTYRGGKPQTSFKDKTLILVDDGLATGLTMQAAIQEVKLQEPAKIILAVPVAPPESIAQFIELVDEVIVVSPEPLFFAVGQFYESFPEVSDQEVKKILE